MQPEENCSEDTVREYLNERESDCNNGDDSDGNNAEDTDGDHDDHNDSAQAAAGIAPHYTHASGPLSAVLPPAPAPPPATAAPPMSGQKRKEVELSSEVVCSDCTTITGVKVSVESCVSQPGGYYCTDQQACKARMHATLPKRARAPRART